MKSRVPDDGLNVAFYSTANGKYLKWPDGEGYVVATGASPQDPGCVFVWLGDGTIQSPQDDSLYLGFQAGIPLLYAGGWGMSVDFDQQVYGSSEDPPPDGFQVTMQAITGEYAGRYWQYGGEGMGNQIGLTEFIPDPPGFGDPCVFIRVDAG